MLCLIMYVHTTGVNCPVWEASNQLVYVDCLRDDSAITKKDYTMHMWPERCLHSKIEQVAQPRVEGPSMHSPPGAFFHVALPAHVRGRQQLTMQVEHHAGE